MADFDLSTHQGQVKQIRKEVEEGEYSWEEAFDRLAEAYTYEEE